MVCPIIIISLESRKLSGFTYKFPKLVIITKGRYKCNKN